jgi:hypothetical protein
MTPIPPRTFGARYLELRQIRLPYLTFPRGDDHDAP